MLTYYLELALRAMRSHRGLTALMLLSIAMGVAACMTTLTVFHVMSGDPIPGKSGRLFNVQLDAESKRDWKPGDEPELQLTRFDAEQLLRARRAVHQVIMTGSFIAVDPAGSGDASLPPFFTGGRWTTADFFTMFEAPFRYGNGWTAADDTAEARVAVISAELNDKLFGGQDSRGKTVRLRDKDFTVVGVLKPFRPAPHYYDLTLGAYAKAADVYIPLSTSLSLRFGAAGNMSCWGRTDGVDPRSANVPCAWLQYWVQLDTPEEADDYRRYLVNYSDQQRAAGRFQRPTNVRLRDVMEWLDFNQVVPGDVRLQVWLALGFLLVCLTNTVGLLLAKFLRRSSEIGVRRALGASRRAIFAQCLVEAGTVGLAGGVLGLGLATLGLWAVRQQPASYAELAKLDPTMLVLTIVIAIGASLLAGVLPAWRACQVTPAIQLKSQ